MDLHLKPFTAGLFIFVVICLNTGVFGMNKNVVPSCQDSVEVCEFHWTADYIWTMMLFNKTFGNALPVVIKNGTFYKRTKQNYDIYGCDNFVELKDEEETMVPYADGRYTMLYAINDEYPGPNIVVYEGQTVVVHVKNALINEGLTIHWHGLEQRGTPYMDGVPMVTQCPINPGETFTYRFKADTVGTHWYHSHHGVTRTDGLYGSIVILPREKRADIPEVASDWLMMVQDFYHDYPGLKTTVMQKNFLLFYMKGFGSDGCTPADRGVEGVSITTQRFDSAVINGKGHKFNETTGEPLIPEVPLEEFLVEENHFYRFRIINTGMLVPFRVSVDGHPLTVVATDGNDIKPIEVESVIVHNGERFDVMIHTNRPKGRYWIRAETLAIKEHDGVTFRHPESTHAILTYKGVASSDVGSTRDRCTKEKPCRILNCHYGQESPDAVNIHQHCLYTADMQATESDMRRRPLAMPTPGDNIKELFLNFHFSAFPPFPPSVNGKVLMKPPVPYLFQNLNGNPIQTTNTSCKREDCTIECMCEHVLKVRIGQILQITMNNGDDQKLGMTHPVHLHGQTFHVLKVAYPSYYPNNGTVRDNNPDIAFSNYYTRQRWSNSSWQGNNVPGLNLKNPPRKDVITIPREGYVVIRFRADNPGFWYMHCHKETHVQLGMALVLQVGELSEMPDIPEGLPVCGPHQKHAANVSDEVKNCILRADKDDDDMSQGAIPGSASNSLGLYLAIAGLTILVLAELGLIVNMKWRETRNMTSAVFPSEEISPDEQRTLLESDRITYYSASDDPQR